MLISRPLTIPRVVYGTCGSGDAVGNLVRSVGDFQYQTVDPGDDPAAGGAAGVIILKPSTTTCVVQVLGQVSGLYSGMTPGAVYWVGADGRPNETPPAPSLGNPQVYVQEVGVAIATGTMNLRFAAPRGIRVL